MPPPAWPPDLPPIVSPAKWPKSNSVLADKAFDANSRVAKLNGRRAQIVISQLPQRKAPLAIDTDLYKWRHLIKNFFGKLKEFKRSDKTDTSFAAMIHLSATIIHSR